MLEFLDSISPMLLLRVFFGVMLIGYLIVFVMIVRDYYKD